MKIETIEHTPMKILLEPIYFEYYGETVKIPAGFCFDGSSVPQIFSWIFPPNDSDILKLGMYHDYLYSTLCDECQNRKDADVFYVDTMTPLWTKILAYGGVRVGGWLSFKTDTNYKKYSRLIKMYRDSVNLPIKI